MRRHTIGMDIVGQIRKAVSRGTRQDAAEKHHRRVDLHSADFAVLSGEHHFLQLIRDRVLKEKR